MRLRTSIRSSRTGRRFSSFKRVDGLVKRLKDRVPRSSARQFGKGSPPLPQQDDLAKRVSDALGGYEAFYPRRFFRQTLLARLGMGGGCVSCAQPVMTAIPVAIPPYVCLLADEQVDDLSS
jgi:hypothetical protein